MTRSSYYVLLRFVTDTSRIVQHRDALDRMVEMSRAMAEAAFARHEASEDPDVRDRAVAAFDICARNTRLSILAGVRLVTGSFEALRTEINLTRAATPTRVGAGSTRLAREREVEHEAERDRDGHPLTVRGRADALGAALAKAPELDPDGRFTAEITDIKTRIAEEAPRSGKARPPPGAEPPLNRAQRRMLERRLRRASG